MCETEPATLAPGWAGSQMSGQRMPCHLSLPPTSEGVSLLPASPPGVFFPQLGRGGVKHWDARAHGGREGSGCSPTSVPGSWLPPPLPPLLAAKDSQGTWQAPAATRWFGTSTTAWAGSQACKADPASSHFPAVAARDWVAAAWSGGGSGVPHSHPMDPRSAHHHVMTLHLRLLTGQFVTFKLQAEEQEEGGGGWAEPPTLTGNRQALLGEDGEGASGSLTRKRGLRTSPANLEVENTNKSEQTPRLWVGRGFPEPLPDPETQ